jgi:3-keto-disaccharide hydrolase
MTIAQAHFSSSSAMKTILVATLFALILKGHAMAEALNFDSAATGAPPEGWTLTMTGRGQPKWTIEPESTAPSKPNVLKQSGQATFPVALKNGTSIRDGFVEVQFKAIAGSEDRAAGIIWRAKDADNYYVVRANALEDNVVLYKTIKGVRSSLDIVGREGGYGVKVPVPANQWHSLRCEFAGARFKVIFNGQNMFEVEDASITDAGMIGLWTKADSVTVFDDLEYGE